MKIDLRKRTMTRRVRNHAAATNGLADPDNMIPVLAGYLVGCLRRDDRDTLAIDEVELINRQTWLVSFRSGLVLRVTVRVEALPEALPEALAEPAADVLGEPPF